MNSLPVEPNSMLGIGYIVGAVGVTSSFVINDLPGKFRFIKSGLAAGLFIHVIGAYAMLTDEPYAFKAIKAIASFGLVNALFGIIKPIAFASIWGLRETDATHKTVSFMAKTVSFFIAASCVSMVALLLEISPSQAMGYGSAVFVAMLLTEVLITREIGALEIHSRPIYTWIVICHHGEVERTVNEKFVANSNLTVVSTYYQNCLNCAASNK